VSYNFLVTRPDWAEYLSSQNWDLVIFDESHYLKNPEAKCTKAALDPGGIVSRADKVLLMSGTPIPNRPHEFWSTLNSLAPDVSGDLTEMQFTNRYTTSHQGDYGRVITGGRNHDELKCRLRGSGFMIRRNKRDVLPQLPPERHSIIVFPQSKGTAEVVKKEQDNVPFTAAEILAAGQPLGYGAMPELRKEMGIEKLPDAISWIKDQLEGGLDKIVLFAYHTEVLLGLWDGLQKYTPHLVYGATPMHERQWNVDVFQNAPEHRVIIGGWIPLGTGWTLTAADTVVMVESSYVPKDNDQCKDRISRIGQKAKGLNVYHLVVEGSIDASVMAKAAGKQYDIDGVMV
jgi:SNF2 family DNA or RNA helicase